MTLGLVSIDGTEYNVPVVDVQRTVNTLDFYAERTADGVLHRQLVGEYINYVVTWAKPHSSSIMANYASLWLAIASPIPFHTCVMPDGYTFVAYIGDGAKDSIRKIKSATVWWGGLTASFIAQGPDNSQ